MKINIVVTMNKNTDTISSDALPDDSDIPVSSEVIEISTAIAQPERAICSPDATALPKAIKEPNHPDKTSLPGRSAQRSTVKAPMIKTRLTKCPVRHRIPRTHAVQHSKLSRICRRKYAVIKHFKIK